MTEGTYELVGPKVAWQSRRLHSDVLVAMARGSFGDAPRTYGGHEGLPEIEGIVWHHPDGRMVKIKAKDFGLSRVGMRMK